MGKSQYSEANQVLKKGPWTPQEDQKLLAYIQQHGHGSWRALPNKAGLQRCGKSCRLRWKNYLRPDIKRGKFSLEEERTIIQLHALLGNRWSAIATQLPERSDNEIKNYWNTHLKKRLAMMGFDPATHKRRPAAAACAAAAAATDPKNASNLSHMAQWESARLQAERRLAKESKSSNRQVDLAEVVEATTAATPLSPGQIIKKMPTTFAPPRCFDTLEAWQSRLSSISCATRPSGFGEIIVNPTAHAKSDSFYASSESSAEAVGGFGGRGAFLGHVSCLGPTEADWIHRIESSCEHCELKKSYWNDNCGPSSFSV